MDIIRQLGSDDGIPTWAIKAATADRTTVTPLLVEALERCEPNAGATIVTAPIDEFKRIHGLNVENWIA